MTSGARLEDLGDVLTVEQLAGVLHCGKRQAYELLRRGEIFSRRVGHGIRIPRSAVETWLAPQNEDDHEARPGLAVVTGGRRDTGRPT